MFHYRSCIARKTAFVTFSSSGYAGADLSLTLFTMAIHLILAISLLVMTDGQMVAYAQTPAPAASQTQPVQETIRPYDIPAGSLSVVLARFASETGVLLAATPELVQDKQSPGLRGTFSVRAALNILLTGTGLEAVRNAEGQYGLQPVANIAGTLPLMTVTGAAINSGVTEGTGSYTTGYSSFGKGQILKELPQTVTAMTHQRIQDQRLFTMDDVMAQTPGVTVQQTDASGGKGAFFSRGFQITNILLDGNSSVVAGGNSPGGPTNTYSVGTLDMAMFDSIEVMRGSNALYGGTAGAPGGAINLVRKRPTKAFQLNAQASAGSWKNYRGELDISGPVALNGHIRGRLVGTYQDGEYFYNYSDSNKKLFYGIVEADITSRTLLTVGGHIQRDDDGYYVGHGLPRYSNGDDLKLPRSTYLGTLYDRYKRDDNNLFIRLDQKIGADWGLSIEAVRGEYDYSIKQFERFGLIDPITNGGIEAAAASRDISGTNKALDASLKGSFHLLGREHRLTLGANYNKNNESTKATSMDDLFDIPNIFAYNPSDYPNPYDDEDIYGVLLADRYNTQKGFYGSLAMKITDPLTLTVSGRLSWYEFDYEYTAFSPSGEPRNSYHSAVKDNKVFTPYLGLTYDLPEDWSVYASIAETYTPQSWGFKGPLPGTPLNPVTGRTYEIGTKGSLFDNLLNLSFALYRTKNNGTSSNDENYPDTRYPGTGRFCCYLDDGIQISQGVDIEISGEIVKGWQILAGYTFNDNETKGGNGRFSTITPKHLFKLWSSYELRGILSGLKLGGGITAQSSNYRQGTARIFNPATGSFDGPSVDYEFTAPGRVLVDLFAQYRLNKHWSATLNVNNVFDKTYYETVGDSRLSNYYGRPRNWMASIKYSY